jgi:predicted RNase H-like HicB family nuclease
MSIRVAVKAEFHLFGVMKRENGWYIATCPPLGIASQGKTQAEAKKNLAEAAELFMISCFERGTFERALHELGWSVDKEASAPQYTKRHPKNAFPFPIPVPFGFEEVAGCRG